MASVRAAKRVSIAWEGNEPFEDTDTLVLTIDGWSLDLRVFTDGLAAGDGHGHDDAGARKDASRIDWSTVARVVELESSTPDRPALRWDHIIDSRPPTNMADQGTFTSLANGDVEEHGIMFNPKTEGYESYVEVWRRFEQQVGEPYCVLKRKGEEHAYLGRVGDRALGLAKDDTGFHAWRDQLEDREWTRVHGISDELLPSLPVVHPPHWATGAEVIINDQLWIVMTAGQIQ